MNDLRFALRQLRKSPGFTLVAVLTLALGIGANTAIFSVIHAVLLRPLPYPEPHRIMALHQGNGVQEFSVAFPDYLDWRRDNTVFEHLAVSRSDSRNLSGIAGREPERIGAAYVTANFFQSSACSRRSGARSPKRKIGWADRSSSSSVTRCGSAHFSATRTSSGARRPSTRSRSLSSA
jgi:hypothetical protein